MVVPCTSSPTPTCACTLPCLSSSAKLLHSVVSEAQQQQWKKGRISSAPYIVEGPISSPGRNSNLRQLSRNGNKKQQHHMFVPSQHGKDAVKKKHRSAADAPTASSYSLAQKSAMLKIIEKLQEVQKTYDAAPCSGDAPSPPRVDRQPTTATLPLNLSGAEFNLHKPETDLFSIGSFWSTPDHPVTVPGRPDQDTKFPWEFDNQLGNDEKGRVKAPTIAELMIPAAELRRLRTLSVRMPHAIKIGRLGVTSNVADCIMQRWHESELVKVKCEGPAAENMLRIHRDLERKTGGLVVWRSGSVAVVYRGCDFDAGNDIPLELETKLEGLMTPQSWNMNVKSTSIGLGNAALNEISGVVDRPNAGRLSQGVEGATVIPSTEVTSSFKQINDAMPLHKLDAMEIDPPLESTDMLGPSKNGGTDAVSMLVMEQIPRKLIVQKDPYIEREYEIEMDEILESLGSRYKEWKGLQPAPVDADLLPSEIPNYRSPYRLLPYGVEPKLTNYEQTNLRRLVRHISPHFALGRNRGLQGLAAAILKLWERSEVAKIAIKPGVQNMRNEIMAEELKRLTGGVLLGRDKYFITLYRGKDFLPRQVAFALMERVTMLRAETVGEDHIAIQQDKAINVGKPRGRSDMSIGGNTESKHLMLAENLKQKLASAIGRKEKAQEDLKMLENIFTPADAPAEIETITEEERFMFRKLGLKMSAFLLVGRRGVFDGVIENMHLHWKHRELVKVIVKERNPDKLQRAARMLEYASGGVLVALVRTSKGHAIIMYRGKNYERPSSLRPDNLLTKKEALKRFVEMQRCASLARNIQALEEEIHKLNRTLEEAYDLKDTMASENQSDPVNSQGGIVEDVECDVTNKKKSDVLEMEKSSLCLDKKNILKLVQSGPIFKADQLTNVEKIKLRKKALKLNVGSRFSVGKSNTLAGLARHLRIHFLSHCLVVIGIKNRGSGTSTQELISELEELTGGVLVSYEANKIIMYRGWPSGEKIPIFRSYEKVSPELRSAMETEDAGWDLDNENSNDADMGGSGDAGWDLDNENTNNTDQDGSEDTDGDLRQIEAELDEEEYYFSQLIDSHCDLAHEVEEESDVPVGST